MSHFYFFFLMFMPVITVGFGQSAQDWPKMDKEIPKWKMLLSLYQLEVSMAANADNSIYQPKI